MFDGRATRIFARKAQFFVKKKYPKQSQSLKNMYTKAQFENPKHLHQTTFENLKYLQQTMF